MTTLAARPRAQTRQRTQPRTLLLLPAGLSLLLGLDAALILLDLPAPLDIRRWGDVHGMVLVLGFLGTVISLERAVALGRDWAYAAPVLLGAGALLTASPLPVLAGKMSLTAGACILLAVYLPLWRRQYDESVLVQALGAVLAIGAALMWAGGVEVPHLVPWLVGFVVLTILGERLELARIAMGPNAGPTLVLLSAALASTAVGSLLVPTVGSSLFGLALMVLTLWVAAHDVARRTVRSSGLPRYMAVCMLAGYGWALVAAATWTVSGAIVDGPAYDAVIHAVFLGFTLSMVMAHAPVILPAVTGRPLPYHPAMYLPVALLHATLVVRVWLGDALDLQLAWVSGGVGNIVAVLAFVAVSLWRVIGAHR